MDVFDFKFKTTGINRQIPQIAIYFKLVDSETQKSIYENFSEAKANPVLFPDVLTNLTTDEKWALMQHIANWLLELYIKKKYAQLTSQTP